MRDKVFIIAEAGVNHNGDLNKAFRLVDEALKAGVDAVKFQSFTTENLVGIHAGAARYQVEQVGGIQSQHEMLSRLELSRDQQKQLFEYACRQGIQFLSSPFDLPSIDFLASLNLELFKIPSGEITNLPYLQRIGALNHKIIMSTGMACLDEIELALQVLENSGTARSKITLLHCNTEYPTPHEDVNLNAMLTLRDTFKIPVGYSDHTLGIEIAVAAVALGAVVIEKHFTLDKNLPGPDHKASMEPAELEQLVGAIRHVEVGMGDGEKKPSKSELNNMPYVRKSIVAARDICKGELYSEDNLTVKRPGSGISPMRWHEVIGKRARKKFLKDQLIEL